MEYTGKIIKGIGSFYTLRNGEGEFTCKARGRFRKEGITPVPGDNAGFDLGPDGKGYLTEILPRKNLLVRPAAANIDKLIIVLSASLPRPDMILVDKLLIQCEIADIIPIIALNKCDAGEDEIISSVNAQYTSAGYKVLSLSAHTGFGLDSLRAEIDGSICCLAGQSAVGKSSLMNAIAPELTLKVGGLSYKTDRGRHTTRHTELFSVCGGYMLDTPGFSLLDMAELEPHDLCKHYPEMRKYTGHCRFPECVHISEPGCAVKPLIGSSISEERYKRYCIFVDELKEKKKHRFD